MAQIKNIKKPGDLIRGADVGIAALDKDGNVVGYKAAAADAGKVLTVGEDGSVAPAEGGGSSLFEHNITIYNTSAHFYANLTIFTDNNTKFTYETLAQYLLNKLGPMDFQTRENIITCTGTRKGSDTSVMYIHGIGATESAGLYFQASTITLENGAYTFSANGSAILTGAALKIVDNVFEI